MRAELRIFEQPRERADGAVADVQSSEDAGEVFEGRLRRLPPQPVRRQRLFHLRIRRDHGAARIGLVAQLVDGRLDVRDDLRLERLLPVGTQLAAAPNVDPGPAEHKEADDSEHQRPLEVRSARRNWTPKRGGPRWSATPCARVALKPFEEACMQTNMPGPVEAGNRRDEHQREQEGEVGEPTRLPVLPATVVADDADDDARDHECVGSCKERDEAVLDRIRNRSAGDVAGDSRMRAARGHRDEHEQPDDPEPEDPSSDGSTHGYRSLSPETRG